MPKDAHRSKDARTSKDAGPARNAPRPRDDADTADTLSEVFWQVARRLRSTSAESLAQWDIAPSHARALMVLGRHQPRRPGDLAEHLHIAARSATEVVDALEDRGLVRRTPDPTDRRATLVELTDAGQALLEHLRAARREQADAYFARLDAADRDHLSRILRALSTE